MKIFNCEEHNVDAEVTKKKCKNFLASLCHSGKKLFHKATQSRHKESQRFFDTIQLILENLLEWITLWRERIFHHEIHKVDANVTKKKYKNFLASLCLSGKILCDNIFNNQVLKVGKAIAKNYGLLHNLGISRSLIVSASTAVKKRTTVVALLFISFTSFSQRDSTLILQYLNQCNNTYYTNPDSSFEFCLRAEKESKYQGNFNYVGDIALGKARYHVLVTDYEMAAKELDFAVDFFEQKKDYAKISKAYSLKSILLDRIGETNESTAMLREAYFLSKNHGDRQGEIARLINLSLDFIDQQQSDSAYHYLLILESLSSFIKEENNYFLNQNLGLYYHMIKDNSKAIYYYQRAKEVSEKFDMIDSKATITARLAESYRELGMLADAENSGLYSFQISVEHKFVFEERDAVEQLVLIYAQKKDFEKAYEFRGKLIEIDVRINKIEKVQKLKEDEYRLNLSEKEKLVAQQALDIQQEQLKSERAEWRNWILSFAVLIIILILSFTIVTYLRTKKLNQTIEQNHIILTQKNREVTDSINYAKQIQEAILSPKKYYRSLFDEIFVFYRPKDIVAGDFYWFYKIDSKIFFAAADCTGHGVPGAMVSVICHSALNRCVKEFDLKIPSEILEKTSVLVRETFSKSDREVKDGMDIALCVYDTQTKLLQFAGANNPVWIIKSMNSIHLTPLETKGMMAHEEYILVELRGTKQPIGNTVQKLAFENQVLQLESGDTIYISTDGFIDQFGGEKGKKFKSKLFKQKLLQVQNNSISEQEFMLASIFDQWKGEFEQVDDVCVIAMRVG